MPQNYRLKSERRNLSLDMIYNMSEDEAIQFIAKARWGSETQQVCPDCGAFDKHHYRRTRKQWVCKHCGHTFSISSKTLFAYKKISAKKLLQVLFMFCNSAKGSSATGLMGLLNLSFKSAWILNHKIREGLLRSRDESLLSGMVHMDGGFFGGKRRHGRIRNYKIAHKHFEAKIASKGKTKLPLNPTQKRNAYKKWKNRRIVFNIREVSPTAGEGATKTRIAILKSENEKDVMRLCDRFVTKGSTIWTDEHRAYKNLSNDYNHHSVEHSAEFMTVDGVHNNHSESYFSRLRRAEYGVFHGMRPQYMLDYAQEMAWKEDMRKTSLLDQVQTLIVKIFSVGQSVWWQGYHQGHRRNDELMNF